MWRSSGDWMAVLATELDLLRLETVDKSFWSVVLRDWSTDTFLIADWLRDAFLVVSDWSNIGEFLFPCPWTPKHIRWRYRDGVFPLAASHLFSFSLINRNMKLMQTDVSGIPFKDLGNTSLLMDKWRQMLTYIPFHLRYWYVCTSFFY